MYGFMLQHGHVFSRGMRFSTHICSYFVLPAVLMVLYIWIFICVHGRMRSLWLLHLALLQNGVKLKPSAHKSNSASSAFVHSVHNSAHPNKCPFSVQCDVCLSCSTVCCGLGLVIQWRAHMISAQGHEHPWGLCMQPQRHWSCQVAPRAQWAEAGLAPVQVWCHNCTAPRLSIVR